MKRKYRLKKKFKVFLEIYLFLFSSCFSLATFAKYVGVISSSTSQQIAKWDVSVENDPNTNLEVVCGNVSQNYNLTVTSLSEVGVKYSVILSNVPSDVLVKIDDGSYVSGVNGVVTFNDVGIIYTSDSVKNNIITFYSELGCNALTNIDVTIDVKFEQINI